MWNAPGYSSYETYMGCEVFRRGVGGAGYIYKAECEGERLMDQTRDDIRWQIKRATSRKRTKVRQIDKKGE